jgi:hypothetical protein
MKKRIVSVCVLLGLSLTSLSAQPSFSAGAGLFGVPGTYDPAYLEKYENYQNSGTVTLMNPASPELQSIVGFHAFVQVSWFGFMARASAMLGGGTGLTYYYDETGIGRVTVDDRLLIAAGTLWIGPIFEVSGKGAVYACLGPTYLYGEYRDKQTVEGNDALSWDRPPRGGGFVLPVMVGVEVRPLPWLGVAVECVALGQQVLLSTISKENQAAPDTEYISMLFPAEYSQVLGGLFPVSYWIQLAFSFHF